MDHRGEFGYALWATMVNLAIGHRRAFGYALWVTAQTWLYAMGHSAE
jgi:hypothetical protein